MEVFTVHRVAEYRQPSLGEYESRSLVVSPTRLRDFTRRLTTNRTVMPVGRLMLDPSTARGSWCAAVTFDDGFIEHGSLVPDVLADLGVHATFFVTSGYHRDGQAPRPIDYLYTLLGTGRVPSPACCGSLTASLQRRRDSAAPAGERLTALSLALELRRWTWQEVADDLMRLAALALCDLDPREVCYSTYMSRHQWWQLASAGHEIAAHSATHRALTSLSDESVVEEIRESVEAVEPLAGHGTAATFAYPFGGSGSFDDRAVRACKDAGVVAAFASGGGPTRDLYRQPRSMVERSGSTL